MEIGAYEAVIYEVMNIGQKMQKNMKLSQKYGMRGGPQTYIGEFVVSTGEILKIEIKIISEDDCELTINVYNAQGRLTKQFPAFTLPEFEELSGANRKRRAKKRRLELEKNFRLGKLPVWDTMHGIRDGDIDLLRQKYDSEVPGNNPLTVYQIICKEFLEKNIV